MERRKVNIKSPIRRATIVLSCRHTREFLLAHLPKENEEIYCMRCVKYVTVRTTGLPSYAVRCGMCHYSRTTGAAKTIAEIVGSKHHRSHPEHEIALFCEGKRIRTWKAQVETLDIELPPDTSSEKYPF